MGSASSQSSHQDLGEAAAQPAPSPFPPSSSPYAPASVAPAAFPPSSPAVSVAYVSSASAYYAAGGTAPPAPAYASSGAPAAYTQVNNRSLVFVTVPVSLLTSLDQLTLLCYQQHCLRYRCHI